MSDDSTTIRFLRKAFKQEDWEYLSQHGAFQLQLTKDDGTSQSFETLVQVGSLLLRQRDDLKRSRDMKVPE